MDKQLKLALYAHFEAQKSIFTNAGCKPVEYIDKFRGQPLNPEQYEYYPLPALFYSRKTVWALEGQSYKATIAWQFHIVTEPTWDTSNIAANKEAGLEYDTFIDLVRDVLDSFKTAYTTTMIRAEDDEMDSGVTVYDVLGYVCEYYATSQLAKNYDEAYPEGITFTGKLRRKKP